MQQLENPDVIIIIIIMIIIISSSGATASTIDNYYYVYKDCILNHTEGRLLLKHLKLLHTNTTSVKLTSV